MKHPMIDAVVLDLWQTLIDTRVPLWKDARVRQALGDDAADKFLAYGRDVAQTLHYASMDDYLSDLVRNAGVTPDTALLDRLKRVAAEELAATSVYQDTIPALGKLRQRGYKVALLSNLTTPYCQAVDTLGLRPYFDRVCFSCERGLMKPDSAFFHLACAELQVPPDRALMVGDSIYYDIEGAHGAGLWAVWLDRNKSGGTPPPGVPRIDTLDRLFDKL